MESPSVTLFEDIFEIKALNPDGYRFENVNRLQATGTTFECELLLDINSEIYTLREADKFALVLASTLHLDGSPADHFSYVSQQSAAASEEPSLADNYEYVMHGRIFGVARCAARNWVRVWDEKEDKYVHICTNGCGCDESAHKMERFVIVAVSFGGLLMRLVGDPRHLSSLTALPDRRLYLLLKKN